MKRRIFHAIAFGVGLALLVPFFVLRAVLFGARSMWDTIGELYA